MSFMVRWTRVQVSSVQRLHSVGDISISFLGVNAEGI